MPRRNYAEKRKKIEKILKKTGLMEIPKDRETGKWVTASLASKKKVRRTILGRRILYICPKCGKPLQFKKKLHAKKCSGCSQALDWGDYGDMQSVYIQAADSGEAAYWAEKYEEYNGTVYGIDIDTWRLSLKGGFPKILFFPFPEGKDYGRFMRLAAKEATIIKEF